MLLTEIDSPVVSVPVYVCGQDSDYIFFLVNMLTNSSHRSLLFFRKRVELGYMIKKFCIAHRRFTPASADDMNIENRCCSTIVKYILKCLPYTASIISNLYHFNTNFICYS